MPDSFVVGLLMPLPDVDAAIDALRVRPEVEVVVTPYFESAELRAERGRNAGKNAAGVAAPVVTDAMRAEWARCDAIVAMDLPDGAPALFPQLRWYQCLSAGMDHVDTATLADMGVIATNASGVASVSMAEFVMGRILQVYKDFRSLDDQQRRHEWKLSYGNELAGRTMGIVGLGAIGREVARRARAFGMTVLATRGSARPGDTDPDVDELHPARGLDDILPRCDVVVIAVPATPETTDLFDAERIAALPDGAILCNLARGVHVVEADLIQALENGRLRAAVLDVARTEPLPEDDPLWDAPNLYLSPHSSVSLDRYMENSVALAADNLRRLIENRPLRNRI